MRQKIAELDAPPQAVVTAPASATVAPVVKPPDVFVVEKEAVATTEVKAHEEDQKHAVAEARARKTKNAKAKPGAETEVKPTIFTPFDTPPPAVPASKEAKLADLLGKYKTDQITPEEYHKERARILAEP